MKKISQYFLQGLLFLVPLFVTVYVIYWVFVRIDGIIDMPVPGVGFIVTIVFVTLVGFGASAFHQVSIFYFLLFQHNL